MSTVQILCEGAICNEGHSAAEREAEILHGLPSSTSEMRDEASKYARREVTRSLALRPHAHVGTDGRGHHLFACEACGHRRIYGNTVSMRYLSGVTG